MWNQKKWHIIKHKKFIFIDKKWKKELKRLVKKKKKKIHFTVIRLLFF